MILNSIISMMGGGLVVGPYTSAFSAEVTSRGGSLTNNELTYLSTFEASVGSDLTEFDRLWIHGLSNNIAARTSFVNPASSIAIAVNGPIFTPSIGYQGNGTTSYVDTVYNPLTQGVKYTLNNSGGFCYCIDDLIGGCAFGNYNGISVGASIFPQDSVNAPGYFINNQPLGSFGTGNSKGLSTVIRLGANLAYLYKNGINNAVTTLPSTSIPNLNQFICNLNFNGNPAAGYEGRISASGFGSANYNQSNFYSALQALGTQIGWAV